MRAKPAAKAETKEPAWALEDEAAELERRAVVLEAAWLRHVHAARNIEPGLAEARDLLIDHYRRGLLEAEERRLPSEALRNAEDMLRENIGQLRDSSRAMIEMVTRSSISVNARRRSMLARRPYLEGPDVDIAIDLRQFLQVGDTRRPLALRQDVRRHDY